MNRKLRRQLRRFCVLEKLDRRIALDATSGASAFLPWYNPADLTYSFVPDGTALGAEHSTLFAELSAVGDQAEWKQAFANAFDDWLTELGVGIQEQPDSGDAFGTFGPTQGDPRFGDIRIGAVPLGSSSVAEAIPHSIAAQGTWAGDILLNSNADWTDLQQVYAVALHEIGHVLGLGHSDDPLSPMYSHSVFGSSGPTPGDLDRLARLYAGVSIESSSDDVERIAGGDDWNETPHFEFDPNEAVSLTATVATTVRYAANEVLTATRDHVLFRLEPVGEIDHSTYLNIVITSQQNQGLIPQVVLYDMAGDPLPTQVLHNSNGQFVVQSRDVEPNQTYFAAITSAATASQNQVGGFQLIAEYGATEFTPTSFVTFDLTSARPIAEQLLHVDKSRLTHFLLAAGLSKSRSATHAVWMTVVDSQGNIVTQVATNHGGRRSSPLVFLDAGDYRLIVESGTADGSVPAPARAEVFVDELSIDVGPGVVDPSLEPNLTCYTPGANPATCIAPDPIVPIGTAVYPDPITLPPVPTFPSLPPWESPNWLYWPADINYVLHNNLIPWDVSGDSLVTPLDALMVINTLNRDTPSSAGHYPDVNQDGRVTPLDALRIINYLNRLGQGGGEGERVIDAAGHSLASVGMVSESAEFIAVDAAAIDQFFGAASFWGDELLRSRQIASSCIAEAW